jgi:putative copper export protein/mono/diheme cytochrome c family protein
MLNGAAPAFEVDGGMMLVLVRSLWVAALLSAFGSLVFRLVVAPRSARRMAREEAARVERGLDRLTLGSLVAALAGACAWLVLLAGNMASADTLAQSLQAVPTVLTQTSFGHIISGQIVALILSVLLFGRGTNPVRRGLAMGGCTLATILQAGHGHAASMYSGPSWLLGADALHLVGAGAWLGGLLPLLLVVAMAPAKAAATAARYFSPLGKLCIAALVVSALFQGWVLVGTIPGLAGTAYGWMVLVKLALLGVLLGFAAINRYRFAPALIHGDPGTARRVFIRSIVIQTGFGLAIVLAAAVLGSLSPSVHVQPVWPFDRRFSLDTIQEDPDFKQEVISAAFALAGAAALLVLAAILRRWVGLVAVLAAGGIAWFAIPHLSLLLVDAYPTSYYTSPTGFAAATIVQGAALYPSHCAACHGVTGHGDGPAAASLPVPPADLTASHLWMHSDGELFWWLTHGIDTPEGQPVMPGFAGSLPDDDRWALIDYIRANNAGSAVNTDGEWTQAVQAPALQATCGNRPVALADLHERIVRLVFGATVPGPAAPDVTTILVAATTPDRTACLASDPAVPQAYAIVSGVAAHDLAGTEILIDGDGWLRALQRPGAPAAWSDPRALAAELDKIRAHPIAADPAPMPMQM